MKEDNKLINSIPFIIVLIIIITGGYFIYNEFFANKKSEEKYEVIVNTLKSDNYTKTEKIEVIANTPNEVEYSFDGGYTWQKDNIYIATSNGELEILVKDSNGDIVKKNHVISSIDNQGPMIEYVYDKDIYVGDSINTNSLFKIYDDISGLSKDISFSSNVLNTKKSGVQKVIVNALDNAGNQTSLTFEIEIKKKNDTKTKGTNDTKKEKETITVDDKETKNPDKKVEDNSNIVKTKYYRYRTKTVVSYDCNSYSCGEGEKINFTKGIVSTGKCDSNYKTSKRTTNNGCVVPTPIGTSCTSAITPVYVKDSNGLYYSRIAIKADTNAKEYKKAPCGTNEIELNGYCHPICEKIDTKSNKVVSTGKCIDNYKTCEQKFNNGCVIPSDAGASCTQSITPRFRKNSDGLIYDGYAMFNDGSTPLCISAKTKNTAPKEGTDATNYVNSQYGTLESNYIIDGYKTSPCGENEKEINGYCFAMCEKYQNSCPTGYFIVDNGCKKVTKKTCYETCTKNVWSDWSKWSTQKVVANENTQVEEKYE